MKECPKCGELNGDANDRCYKCNTFLGYRSTMGKICRKCNAKYDSKKEICDECGNVLSVYEPSYELKSKNNSSTDMWMYVISFLIPIVGIILGCIQVGKGDKTGGRNLIITAIVSAVLYAIVTSMIIDHDSKEMEEELNSIYEMYDDEYDYWD